MTVRIELRRDAGRIGPESGPWIRRRQIARIHGSPDPHALARVVDRHGDTIGYGLVSAVSTITVRLLTFGPEPPEDDWLERRLQAAFDARTAYAFAEDGITGYREVNSEGDGLPGLVVDRYGDDLVAQITTAPMAAREDAIVRWLQVRRPGRVHVVLPESAASREGCAAAVRRDHDDALLHFTEHGLELAVPAPPSQKTGGYLDQRANRRFVARLARKHGGPVLDVGCHVGGFALHAARSGLEAVGVDQSRAVLDVAHANAQRNNVRSVRWVESDMFGPLQGNALAGPFGTVVLDPPRLAKHKGEVARAVAALERLVARVAPRVAERGHLVLCSCSHHIGADLLDRIVAATAVPFTRVASLGAGVDHPIAPGHREGEYLRVNVYQQRA